MQTVDKQDSHLTTPMAFHTGLITWLATSPAADTRILIIHIREAVSSMTINEWMAFCSMRIMTIMLSDITQNPTDHFIIPWPAISTVCDRYFCSFLGPTFPNRMFSHSAQTDRLSNSLVLSTLPTIWDRLAAAGVSGRYYFSNLPFLGLWGPKYTPISRPYQQFLLDAAAGALPVVSFIDPKFTITDTGDGNDDHPHADIRAGDAFLAQTFFALANGPLWPRANPVSLNKRSSRYCQLNFRKQRGSQVRNSNPLLLCR